VKFSLFKRDGFDRTGADTKPAIRTIIVNALVRPFVRR